MFHKMMKSALILKSICFVNNLQMKFDFHKIKPKTNYKFLSNAIWVKKLIELTLFLKNTIIYWLIYYSI